MQKREINKEAIIAEYLTGDYTYRQLGCKYGISFQKIHNWVSKYKGKSKLVKDKVPKIKSIPVAEANLPTDVKQLQAELRKAKLHNEVLEEMLKLSEDLTGIELRKKFGTKRF
ncbi:MAG: hypothetical protein EKK39_02145 [Sphingobacteriales bacterium]|uniref:helix-turn-helix domain-containing protein n=1 Tax=Hydrotalea flava TaxID=714549 RepID=UPI0008368EF1|nr:helix-turn-helix domain-containing protein [Hydrotalea flava]RTL55975.1 MAG: hypothetical protein EKK39_02145 [Sphingobacteriales bacterium]